MKTTALYAALGAVLLAGWAQAQQADPLGGGGRNLGALERDWSSICFDLQLSGAQFDTLRTRYQEAWTWRAQVLEQMQAGTIDRQTMLRQMEQVRLHLDRECHLLLSAEQWARLNQLREARRVPREGFRTPGR
jgi:hypothetical protein